MRRRNEEGIALVTAMMMLALMSALVVGATALAISEQRSRFQMKDRTQAFQAAHSGLEKLTNDLGNLFTKTYAPTDAEIQALRNGRPAFPGVTYAAPGQADGTGYTIVKQGLQSRTLNDGPYAGLNAQVTPYQVTVTAKTRTEGETTLRRDVNTVAIPVFQFGIFSDGDLSYFPGPNFNFGGRVHTNGNLFLAKGGSGAPPNNNQLILADKVTAVRDVIRTHLSNGFAAGPGTPYAYNVRILATENGCDDANINNDATCKKLELNEGSVIGPLGSPANPDWADVSEDKFNLRLRNGTTGATHLNLPLSTDDARPIDLIRRPRQGEKTAQPAIYRQRYYQYASLRILLSDDIDDIQLLPDATSGNPATLQTYSGISSQIRGYIKIDKQNAAGTGWTNITSEILDRGVSARGYSCNNGIPPSQTAIIRLQRPNNASTNESHCQSTSTGVMWPLQLFDAREGRQRDSSISGGLTAGGIMGYVELDVRNLRKWLSEQTDIMDETGYVVYFSDRRGIKNDPTPGNELGELLFEDVVNTTSAGTDFDTLQPAEDVNGNGVLDRDGRLDNSGTVDYFNTLYTNAAAPSTQVRLFRRALKLVNGNRQQMVEFTNVGLTIAAENPVYIQGDYNADTTEDNTSTAHWNESYDQPHIAAAIIADAVTLLSRSWYDRNSFSSPYAKNGRTASLATTYRVAIVAGKTLSFPKPSWGAQDFGTDGGTHNFLRYLENWDGRTLWYRGSMVSFYTSRQAVGTYKCCEIVYGAPTREYTYDRDFQFPDLLPPRTPMIRDINVTSFAKIPPPTN